jgi:alcohol dehydrogenase class IV
VVTTLGGFPILDHVTGALGSRRADVFTGIVQHVPRGTVDALQAEIERVNADCLVSFGGGSPIDSCKVAIHGVAARRELVHIAVPTLGGGDRRSRSKRIAWVRTGT